jgi:hypothetical protein
MKGHFYTRGESIIFQHAEYIEDGWYIELTDGVFVVREIPMGGGDEIIIGSCKSFNEALKIGQELI